MGEVEGFAWSDGLLNGEEAEERGFEVLRDVGNQRGIGVGGGGDELTSN